MKRLLIELAAQLVALVLLVLVISAIATFLGATVGATANAVAPDFHVELAGRFGLICKPGETVSVRHDRTVTGVDSHGRPYAGQSNDIYCTSSAEGTSRLLDDQETVSARLATLGFAIGAYTTLFFVLMFVPVEAAALFVIHKVTGALVKPKPASQAIIPN